VPLYKILSPVHLLKLPFANDSNSLDKNFYDELLHIIGLEEVKLVDRKPAGNFIFEATTIATKDYFTAANDGVTGVMSLTHGSKNGFKVKLDAPRISIGNPQYQDLDGVQMLNIPFTASPVDGNDELTITFK